MTHRVDQIVDAIKAIVEAQVATTNVKVYAHRRLSLGADQDELPAISIDFGADESSVEDNETETQFLSALTVVCTAVVATHEEPDLREQLLALRRSVHIALMADRKLGLAFVPRTYYAGAPEPPEFDVDGDVLLGFYSFDWVVHYYQNITDPGD